MDGKAWLAELLGSELVTVYVRVRAPDVVYVKGILEASEGLGAVFAEPRTGAPDYDGGALVIATPRSRAPELRAALADIQEELEGALWEEEPARRGHTPLG